MERVVCALQQQNELISQQNILIDRLISSIENCESQLKEIDASLGYIGR